jgi:hypothetical protein
MNGGASGNLAVSARYVARPVGTDAGELTSPQPAEELRFKGEYAANSANSV